MTGDAFPAEANLGRNCLFWSNGDSLPYGCAYPKAELMGRLSCEGMIDDVCLFMKDGRLPRSLTVEQIVELKTRPPSLDDKSYIPPGSIT